MSPSVFLSTAEPLNSEIAQKPRRGQRTFLLFEVHKQGYGLPIHDVREVVPMVRLWHYPGLPAVVAGFLNLGGIAVPVLRPDRLFGTPELVPGMYTPLLILRHPDSQLALMAEKVQQLVTVPDEDIMPVTGTHSFNDCVEGFVSVAGRVVLILTADRLLLEKEHQSLAEFQDREQSRLREWEGLLT
jgi:purine-binding chemotaxis protein CheW